MNSHEKALDIVREIQLHRDVYRHYGVEVPPYRLTRKEAKILWRKLKPTLSKEVLENNEYDDIRNYYGVDIEIVTKG